VAQFLTAWSCCEQGHAASCRAQRPVSSRLVFSKNALMTNSLVLARDSSQTPEFRNRFSDRHVARSANTTRLFL
jgi:hypothetical protein